MITYGSEVTIARPPSVVFPYLIERDKQALWADVPMEPLTEGPLRVGWRMALSLGRKPLGTRVILEFSTVERDRRLAFVTVGEGSVRWTGEYRLEPAAAGTRLSQSGTLEFRGLWRLAEPLVGAEIRRNEIGELEKLKALLEALPSA